MLVISIQWIVHLENQILFRELDDFFIYPISLN
jgi:hypothetical protein